MLTNFQLFRAYAAILLVAFSAQTVALDLDSPATCQAIGGSWTLVMKPPQVGHCELAQSFTVQNGDRLFLSGAVPLSLVNNATLTVDGVLRLSTQAKLQIYHGNLINNDLVTLDDNSRLYLYRGKIENRQVFRNEGIVSNAYQSDEGMGIFNYQQFDNIDGGIISNVGRFQNMEGSQMGNTVGGTINNYVVAVYTSNNDAHSGTFNIYKGATLNVRGTFSLTDGGVLNNYASVDIASANFTVGPTATVQNSRNAVVTIGNRGRVSIDGMFLTDYATVRNNQGGSINLGSSGYMEFVDALLYNAPPSPAGSIVAQGKLRFECSKFDNQGSFVGFFIDYCKPGPVTIPKK